jgi:hypothetical protein
MREYILVPTPGEVWNDIYVESGQMYPATTDDGYWQLAAKLSECTHISCQLIFSTGVTDGKVYYFDKNAISRDDMMINDLIKKWDVWW